MNSRELDKKLKEESEAFLRKYVQPETQITSVLLRVNQSTNGNFSRIYRLFVAHNNNIIDITSHVARYMHCRMIHSAKQASGICWQLDEIDIRSLSFSLYGNDNALKLYSIR